MTRLPRRAVLGGLGAALATPALLRPARAETHFAPSAASLARSAAPPRDASPLQMTDGTGAPRQIAEFAGQIVVLNLWGPWCLPCRREMPSLARLGAALEGRGVAVLPLAFDWRGAAGVRRFYKETDIANLPVLIGDGDNLNATLGIENLPTTVVIDRAGMTHSLIEGEAHWDDAPTQEWLLSL
ncbi:MAG: TlpA disulfide reductase family protein [Paracoccaceae bacterium]